MNLHEYQAKQILAEYGVPTPPGKPSYSVEEALQHASELGGKDWVIKAQVHAGGRGKAGGVKLVQGEAALEAAVKNMLGTRLITKQSAPHGQPIHCVLVQTHTDIAQEFYLGMLVDRSKQRIIVMASSEGGMAIEALAIARPEAIHSISIEPSLGLQDYQCRQLGFALQLAPEASRQLAGILHRLYRLFIDKDLSLVEINPLIMNTTGDLVALDAKISLDDNALFRQARLAQLHDASQEDEKEGAAKQLGLNYVSLEGDIGCMVNGAGLAMATMDIIKLYGGRPANFLDVGGGATTERVAEALRLVVSEQHIRAILVNIFGGIVRCDLIAEGIIQAVAGVGVQVPVVVRLEGTNVEQGKKILRDSTLTILAASSLSDAARQVVAAARAAT